MQKPSVCPLDCPDTCSLSVTVESDQITTVRGSRVNPVTGGAICAKVVNYYPQFVHGDNRIRTPLRRIGKKGENKFTPISWDTALDLVYENVSKVIDEFGPQAVIPFNYAGPHGQLACDSMSLRFFHRLGASLLSRSPLCGGIRSEAYKGLYGTIPGMPIQQVKDSKLIIVWGNNASVSNLHLLRYINAAKRTRAAKVVVVDPKRTKIAEQAHLHLSLRPGTDVVLALALAAELERTGGFDKSFIHENVLGFEAFMEQARQFSVAAAASICGLNEADVLKLARWYKESSPAAIAWGNGLERNRNGGSSLMAVGALPALGGKFGVSGGGLVAGAANAFPKTPSALTCPEFIPEGTRTINILDVSRLILDDATDPPLKALFIYNHNPVIVHPDQNRMKRALAKEDVFIVGIDIAMTDSMAYADVILPACSHFEHDDIFAAYGQQFLQRAQSVISPVAESLPNTEIFRRLAHKFGFTEEALLATDQNLMDAAFDRHDPRMQGIQPSRLPVEQALKMEFDGEEAILFKSVFPKTPSGKIELESSYLQETFAHSVPKYRPLASDYPYTLITPASDHRTSSTFGGLAAGDETPVLEIHPQDAMRIGLTDGCQVKIWNELGEVHLPLKITEKIRPGVLCSEKGAWFKTAENRQTVSALAPLHKADIADGACYNDARVDVAAIDA